MAQVMTYGLRPPPDRFNLLLLPDGDVYLEHTAVSYLPDCATQGASDAATRCVLLDRDRPVVGWAFGAVCVCVCVRACASDCMRPVMASRPLLGIRRRLMSWGGGRNWVCGVCRQVKGVLRICASCVVFEAHDNDSYPLLFFYYKDITTFSKWTVRILVSCVCVSVLICMCLRCM